MKIANRVVHLLSGGMDSVVMLYGLIEQGNEVSALLFDYRQRHVRELEFARYHCRRLDVGSATIEIPQLRGSTLTDGRGGVVVPNRNAILLSLAVNVAAAVKADVVTFACNRDDAKTFPDCRPSFVRAFNATLAAADLKVRVCAPYIMLSKRWIAATGRELGVDLDKTWSCYRGGRRPCGKCPACRKREEATCA